MTEGVVRYENALKAFEHLKDGGESAGYFSWVCNLADRGFFQI